MNIVDLILLGVLASFVLCGFWFGLVQMVGSLAGMFLGAFAAGQFYSQVGGWIAPLIGGNRNLADVVAFIALFVIVTRLVGLLFGLLERVFGILYFIPFLKTFSRLLGAVFGLVEGVFGLGLAIYFLGRFPVSPAVSSALTKSILAPLFNLVGLLLSPLLPIAVRALTSVFESVT